jgi:hypothetical protein
MAEKGHDDQFPPPSLDDRCRLGEATFAGMGGKEEHAPMRSAVQLGKCLGQTSVACHSAGGKTKT